MNFNHHLLKVYAQDHLSQLRSQADLKRELAKGQEAIPQRTSARASALSKPVTNPPL